MGWVLLSDQPVRVLEKLAAKSIRLYFCNLSPCYSSDIHLLGYRLLNKKKHRYSHILVPIFPVAEHGMPS